MKKLSELKNLIEQLHIRRNIQTELCPDFMCGLSEEEDKKERIIKLKEYAKINKTIDLQLNKIRTIYREHAGVYSDDIKTIRSSDFVPYILGTENIEKLPALMANIKEGDLKQYIKLEFCSNHYRINIINEDILQELFF